ncbi:hypothetical protein K474DRAFT_1665530 [Panus rudis PR-1116 ss-1]|nr:hypothetical protein K474DRAFT_1665530 [Panus rudis PR-1116 ss-1]
MTKANSPSLLFLIASSALLLSGIVQMITAWMQTQAAREMANCEPRVVITPVRERFEDDYTWIGDDRPNALPLSVDPPVALTIENSRHYAASSEDADAEWLSIYPGTNRGFIRLGPNKRFFGLAMFHQIHCLNSLRLAMTGRPPHSLRRRDDGDKEWMNDEVQIEHAHHCLNYLRQAILCNADLTLEPEIREGTEDVGEGLGVTHVCRDWSKVYAFVEQNEVEWKHWLQSRNTTVH